MTGKEYLKKHIGETNIPEEHWENEIGEMMDWYADDYHQEQVKKLSLSSVSKSLAKLIQEQDMSAELRTYLMEINLKLS